MGIKDGERTIGSLRKVNDFPFYAARYHGDYRIREFSRGAVKSPAHVVPFFEDLFEGLGRPVKLDFPPPREGGPACSAFFCRDVNRNALVGKNLDWKRDPVLLLRTEPPGGFASLSLVNLSFCDIFGLRSLEHSLLLSPYVPLDGMNEWGLVASVLSVDEPASYPAEGGKPSVGDFNMVRIILDTCRDVEEGLAAFKEYAIMRTGPLPVHYLLADSRQSSLVEFFDGAMHIKRSPGLNFLTNFLLLKDSGRERSCPRYLRLEEGLGGGARLNVPGAESLLKDVSVHREGYAPPSTIWSLVYIPGELKMRIRVGRDGPPYAASLGRAG